MFSEIAQPLRGTATDDSATEPGPNDPKATIDELAATTTRQEMDNLGMSVEDGEEDDDDEDDDDEDDGDSDEDDGDDENDD